MNILHIVDLANSNGNGVAEAVKKYVFYEGKNNKVAVYNLKDRFDVNNGVIYTYDEYKTISSLPEPFNKPDVVVFNEIYKPKYIKLYKECRKNNVKYVIIPHGSLVTDAQNEKKLKKIIGNMLLFNNFIKKADCIQFLNIDEKNNSKFKYKKYIISGNGMDFDGIPENYPQNNDIVYIGRYSLYVKGLDYIVELCKKYKDWFEQKNIKIQLYGRDSAGGINKLNNMINEANVGNIIKVNDAVYGNEKKEVLKNALLFIQLSRHEGQPMGIIEALAYGLPCVVTYKTSFGKYLNNNNCGIGVNHDIDEIYSSIEKIISNSEIRDCMSKNAKKCVRKDFDWDKIIGLLIKEYKEL